MFCLDFWHSEAKAHHLPHTHTHTHTLTASLSLAAVQLQSVFSSLVCQIQRRRKRKRRRQANRWRRKVGKCEEENKVTEEKGNGRGYVFCCLATSIVPSGGMLQFYCKDQITSCQVQVFVPPTHTHTISVQIDFHWDYFSYKYVLKQTCVCACVRACVCGWSDQCCTQIRHTGILRL